MTLRRKAWYWSLVPLAGRNRYATTLGETIFLTPKQYADQDTTRVQALIAHEGRHVEQHQRDGLRYVLGYVFSRKARCEYETEAYAQQGIYLARRGENYRTFARSRAEALASWRYLWAGDADAIEQELLRQIEQELV